MKRTGCSISGAVLALLMTAPSAKGQATAVGAVTRLYRDYAWEAVIDQPDQSSLTLMGQPRDVLRRYLDDSLTDLVLADRACARKQGECALDWVPIWDSQDPGGASGIRIAAASDSSVVAVTIRYRSDSSLVRLAYHMVKTARGWRVHDIVSARGVSLLDQLRPSRGRHRAE